MTLLFYLLIRKYYTNKQYILEKTINENKIETIKIRGSYLDLKDNKKNHMYIYKEQDNQWYYTLNNEEKQEILCGDPFSFGNCSFKIKYVEKRGGILFFLSLFFTLITILFISNQLYFTVNRDEVNMSKISDINKQTNDKFKNADKINNKKEEIHSIVLQNDNIFDYNILTNWQDFRLESRMRRSLKSHSSEVGICVSEFQYKINWEKVKNDGIDYALIRLGCRGYETGKIKEDEQFTNNIKGAEKNNIKKGVYFYSQAINKKEMDEEIKLILETIKDYSLEYPIAISLKRFEASSKTRVHALTNKQYIDLIKYFCITIKQKGYIPMIMGENDWFLQFNHEFDGYLKLVSNEKEPPKNVKNCIIWEYNEKAMGAVKGIDTDVELSISVYSNDEN